jgi:hypothetical protein
MDESSGQAMGLQRVGRGDGIGAGLRGRAPRRLPALKRSAVAVALALLPGAGSALAADCTLTINGESQHFAIERDDTYRAMHEDMLTHQATVATIGAASETDALILDIELSAQTKKWIER